ncbi:MAG: DUF4177 domain-containing protein [Clostridia bacterium]|nr:DUF4177 domain-containing protein [Clostridia bacterium]
MKFCTSCGTQLAENSLFCTKCGAAAPASAPKPPASEPAPAPADAPAPTPAAAPASPSGGMNFDFNTNTATPVSKTKYEYKVLSQKDKWFSGKFDPALLEQAINAYAQQGWRVVTCATADIPGFGGPRQEFITVLEREK